MSFRLAATAALSAIAALGFSQNALWTRVNGPYLLLKDGSLGLSVNESIGFSRLDTQTQLGLGYVSTINGKLYAASVDGTRFLVGTDTYDDRDHFTGVRYRVVTGTGEALLEFFRNERLAFQFTADGEYLLSQTPTYERGDSLQFISIKTGGSATFVATAIATESESVAIVQRRENLYLHTAARQSLSLVSSNLPDGFELNMAQSRWGVGLAKGRVFAISAENGKAKPVKLAEGEYVVGFLNGPNLLVSQPGAGKLRLLNLEDGVSKPLPNVPSGWVSITPDRSRIVLPYRKNGRELFRPSDGDHIETDERSWVYSFNGSSLPQAISKEGYFETWDDFAKTVEAKDFSTVVRGSRAFSLQKDTAVFIKERSKVWSAERLDLKTGAFSDWFRFTPENGYLPRFDGSRGAITSRLDQNRRVYTTYGYAGVARDIKLRRYPDFQYFHGYDSEGNLVGFERGDRTDNIPEYVSVFDPKTGDRIRRILFAHSGSIDVSYGSIVGLTGSICIVRGEDLISLIDLRTEKITLMPQPIQNYWRTHSAVEAFPSKDGKWLVLRIGAFNQPGALFSTSGGRKVMDVPDALDYQFSPDGKRLLAIEPSQTTLLKIPETP